MSVHWWMMERCCALREPLGDDTASNAEHEPELGDDSSSSSSSSSSSDGDAGPRSEAGGDLEDMVLMPLLHGLRLRMVLRVGVRSDFAVCSAA